MIKEDTTAVDHGLPKKVDLEQIEAELGALEREAVGADTRRTFGRMLTLVVYSEVDEPPDRLDALIGEIVVRASARGLLIRRRPAAAGEPLDAYVSAHCLIRGSGEPQQCAEQVTLSMPEDHTEELRNAILSLRLRDLPLVVWWRAHPDPDDVLLADLLKDCDQVILDSSRFKAAVGDLAHLVGHLRRQSERVPLGDINWARLTPWRELIAQFFDAPEHLDYLKRLDTMTLEYCARDGAGPAQPVLITMWLATMLKWRVVSGSWNRAGRDRSVTLSCEGREINVHVHGVLDSEAPPGWLTSFVLSATGEPPADFNITWCGEHCVKTSVKIGDRTVERSSALTVPDEVTLVCEEFDASRRDRVYHQALQVLEQLLQ